jgi:hypothetical protein
MAVQTIEAVDFVQKHPGNPIKKGWEEIPG